jgi:hypothetical protein
VRKHLAKAAGAKVIRLRVDKRVNNDHSIKLSTVFLKFGQSRNNSTAVKAILAKRSIDLVRTAFSLFKAMISESFRMMTTRKFSSVTSEGFSQRRDTYSSRSSVSVGFGVLQQTTWVLPTVELS